jgi:hypothetical protein
MSALVADLSTRFDRVTQRAVSTLVSMQEVAQQLMPQLVQWNEYRGGSAGQNLTCAQTPP